MDFTKYVSGYWSIWLVLVILWNFGFPTVAPIWDVIVAVLLSFFFQFLKNKKNQKT